MYGVWIKGKGWLREGGKVYEAETEKDANAKASKNRGAFSSYITPFLIQRETYFLDQEEAGGSSYPIHIASAFAEASQVDA